jgi:RNA polymerase-binding transcription factor DksA
MFEPIVSDEATEDIENIEPQLPQTHPLLTPAARTHIESELRARRADLLEGITRNQSALADLESAGRAAPADRVTRTRQHLALLDGELGQTTTALQRLAEGTYGVCVRCGTPIPQRRLEVVPSALRCGECTPQ